MRTAPPTIRGLLRASASARAFCLCLPAGAQRFSEDPHSRRPAAPQSFLSDTWHFDLSVLSGVAGEGGRVLPPALSPGFVLSTDFSRAPVPLPPRSPAVPRGTLILTSILTFPPGANRLVIYLFQASPLLGFRV